MWRCCAPLLGTLGTVAKAATASPRTWVATWSLATGGAEQVPPRLRSLSVPPQCANWASAETAGATRGQGNEVLTWVASLGAHAYTCMQAQTTPSPSLLMQGEGAWTGCPRPPPCPPAPGFTCSHTRSPLGGKVGLSPSLQPPRGLGAPEATRDAPQIGLSMAKLRGPAAGAPTWSWDETPAVRGWGHHPRAGPCRDQVGREGAHSHGPNPHPPSEPSLDAPAE